MPAVRKARWNELMALVGRGLMVRTDSRAVRPGEVFVLMPAAGANSEAYLAQALANGAAWIVAGPNMDAAQIPSTAKLVSVADVPDALGLLAAKHFRTREQAMQVVAVTGTNGKTTITYLLEGLLAAAGRKVGVLGTVSYRWPGTSIEANLTTPGCWRLHELFAQMSADGVDTVVMETSSHALHQKRVAGLEFDACALINLTQDHLDYHGDFEDYYQAKKLLFTSFPRTDKFKAANADDAYGLRLLGELPEAVGFTLGNAAAPSGNRMLRGSMASCTGRGVSLRMEYEGRCWNLDSGLVGAHNASNLMAAQAVGLGLGLGPADMQALAPFTGVPGRLERVPNDQGLDIFVDYAHTPDALVNVLGALRALDFSRVLTVFGCGGDRDRTKRPLMGRAVSGLSDVAILTSDNPRHEDPLQIMADVRPGLAEGPAGLVIEEPDRYKALCQAISLMRPGDVLLVAGKGHENYQQVGDVKHPFSDVLAVGRALREVRP